MSLANKNPTEGLDFLRTFVWIGKALNSLISINTVRLAFL